MNECRKHRPLQFQQGRCLSWRKAGIKGLDEDAPVPLSVSLASLPVPNGHATGDDFQLSHYGRSPHVRQRHEDGRSPQTHHRAWPNACGQYQYPPTAFAHQTVKSCQFADRTGNFKTASIVGNDSGTVIAVVPTAATHQERVTQLIRPTAPTIPHIETPLELAAAYFTNLRTPVIEIVMPTRKAEVYHQRDGTVT